MAKQKKPLIENLTFDNAMYAQETLDKAKTKLEKSKLGLIVSGVASVFGLIGLFVGTTALGTIFCIIAIAGAIASYIMAGGFGIAVKTAGKLAKFGWYMAPFPFDIVICIFTFIFAVFAFFCVPVIFVFITRLQQKRTIKNAEEYLRFCKTSTAQTEA